MKEKNNNMAAEPADDVQAAVQRLHVRLLPGYQENHVSKVIHAIMPMCVSRRASLRQPSAIVMR